MTRKVENSTVKTTEPVKVSTSKKGTIAPLALKRTPSLVGKEIDVNCHFSVASDGKIIITIDPTRALYETEKGNIIIMTTSGIVEYNGLMFNLNVYEKSA